MSHRLLILACSQAKRSDPGLLPAIERYDGPAFRVVRKYRRENPSCVPLLLIQILSAKYGLLSIDQPISNYDYKMTTEYAQNLHLEICERLELLVRSTRCTDAFIYASQTYLAALGNYKLYLPSSTGTVTLRSTPGYKLAELHHWLYRGQKSQRDISTRNIPKAVQVKGVEIPYSHEEIVHIARQALHTNAEQARVYSSWYTIVGGQRVSPKWLISTLTGLPPSSFHTDSATRALRQLGFEIYPISSWMECSTQETMGKIVKDNVSKNEGFNNR